MNAIPEWAVSDDPLDPPFPASPKRTKAALAAGELPPAVEAAMWRGCELGRHETPVIPSGFEQLDVELPGGGWPCRSLTELLHAQPAVLEWRLLGPALRRVVEAGPSVVVVGPPRQPHLPGLRHCGIDERHLVWIQADTPSERLWCTEQLIKSNAFGALVAWLPQARPEQIRRLQVCAQACEGPVFLCRPASVRHEASAAPLRVLASFGVDWELAVHLFKRRGPVHEGLIRLPSVPGGLRSVLTPRLGKPSRLLVNREAPSDALGSPGASPQRQRHATAH